VAYLKRIRSVRHKRTQIFFLVLFTLAGCATLKQCAYEGVHRDQWQQPEKVIESLAIKPGEEVADLGAGGGYFTFRLAKAVGPNGTVYAIDVDPDMVQLLEKEAKDKDIRNVDVIRARPDNPLLQSKSVDLIFTVDTYHHLNDRVNYFARAKKFLRPNGRIAIIDFNRNAWLEGLWRHYTPTEFIKREMENAGYRLQKEYDFLERQSFLIFTPAP